MVTDQELILDLRNQARCRRRASATILRTFDKEARAGRIAPDWSTEVWLYTQALSEESRLLDHWANIACEYLNLEDLKK